MDPFTFNTTAQIVFRPGAAADLGLLVGNKVGANVLWVTDPGLRKLALCDPALASLRSSGIAVTIFDEVEPCQKCWQKVPCG